ncbi:MAG: glycoside hydrolase family 32 protein, partial [Bacteroidales bacterium]|nr:glycoside hydrolase family 32 protein [Bacteroidales bacterium]
NMSWGHATSTDLVNWTNHPVIIRPDDLGNAFSGSAVVDENNTAGFGSGAIVALYTSAGRAGQQQSIAYSLDGGYSYTKYEGNPVITSTETMRSQRDPKVQWIDDKWVMAISFDKYIRFYGSTNLKDWEFLSAFSDSSLPAWGTWECPDLIKMDYKGETKWVATINADQTGPNGVRTTLYFVGQWTGTEFVADPLPYPLLLDYGVDQYAGVTFGNTGDRHVQLAWLTSSPFPGSETPATKFFTGGMSLPHDIFLKEGPEHVILASVPAKEVYDARKPAQDLVIGADGKCTSMLKNNTGSYQIEITFSPKDDEKFGFNLSNSKGEIVTYTFDPRCGQILTDRSKCGLQDAFPKSAHCPVVADVIRKDEYKVELFIDRMTSEMFVNDGDCVMTNCLFPTEYLNSLEVFGNVDVKSARIFEFK